MTSVSAILEQTAVAYYSELLKFYYCKTCRHGSLVTQWQGVDSDTASRLALELGMTTCSRCGNEIGHEDKEPA
jgi:hypothetical protein